MKICKICKSEFKPYNSIQSVCSPKCALIFNSEKEVKKRVKQMKVEIETRPMLIQALQTVFNKYILIRDKKLPCISCGTTANVKYDAGHFWPTTYSYLRFHEDNVHKQCSNNCNLHKSGNFMEYEPGLTERIGFCRVQWLRENRHKELNLTKDELRELITIYKKKVKNANKN
jgi:hypothetical protein